MVFLEFMKLPLSGDYNIISQKENIGFGIRQANINVGLSGFGSCTLNYTDNVQLCHSLGTNYSILLGEKNVLKDKT